MKILKSTSSIKSPFKVGLILLTFFVISFFTNILGSLNPSVSLSYNLSKTMAGLLPFAFFIAYGVLSIPSGFLTGRIGVKQMLVLAFVISLIGTIIFVLHPTFRIYIISLFTIGAAMSMLQVIINPLLRVAGGEENYAFFSVLAQVTFGAASFVSPKLYSWVVVNLHSGEIDESAFIRILNLLVPEDISWAGVYWFFALIGIVMIAMITLTKFEKIDLKDDEKAGTTRIYVELFKNRIVIMYFIGIFAYVGTEQGISYWMSKFLSDYHQYDYQTMGADAVANYWGLMTIGGLLGLVVIKLFDSKQVLMWFTLLTIACLSLALFGSKPISLYGFQASGFFMSVMYPILISLALNSMGKHHGAFAGILMSAIMGGAIIQLLIGVMADVFTLKAGMMLNFIGLLYIFFVGIWAKPLVNNKIIKLRLNIE